MVARAEEQKLNPSIGAIMHVQRSKVQFILAAGLVRLLSMPQKTR
jgi:hypothetical protein